jgi:hypothetical protein
LAESATRRQAESRLEAALPLVDDGDHPWRNHEQNQRGRILRTHRARGMTDAVTSPALPSPRPAPAAQRLGHRQLPARSQRPPGAPVWPREEELSGPNHRIGTGPAKVELRRLPAPGALVGSCAGAPGRPEGAGRVWTFGELGEPLVGCSWPQGSRSLSRTLGEFQDSPRPSAICYARHEQRFLRS